MWRELLFFFSFSFPVGQVLILGKVGWNNEIYFCDSYAIGGLAGGEDKDSFWRVVAQCTAALPEDKPRYVMV